MKKIFYLFVILLTSFASAQESKEQANLVNKIEKIQQAEEKAIKTMAKNQEEDYTAQAHSGLIMPLKQTPAQEQQIKEEPNKNLPPQTTEPKQEVKQIPNQQPKQEVKANKVNTQNKDPKGVDWIGLSKGKLNVKMQRRKQGIPTPNLSMKFNNVYQSLFRNIPWLMGGSANVYVYQNRENFLEHEPVASDWSGAFFSPDNNRIVMYDEPNDVSKMLSQFQHELTHLFVENYFCPPGSNKPEPPVWLNEGLAVNMEDITNKASGGVWARDLIVINFLPSSKSPAKDLREPRPISNTTVRFLKFSDFVQKDSYDSAVAAGKVEDWYMQAYAMVRFLFKPYNSQYPEKRIQFEQFTKLLNTYQYKKGPKGRFAKDEDGRRIKIRTPLQEALKTAYGYESIDNFEIAFWQWLYPYQAEQREKLRN